MKVPISFSGSDPTPLAWNNSGWVFMTVASGVYEGSCQN